MAIAAWAGGQGALDGHPSVGCSATFGATDPAVTTASMRRAVTAHSVIAFFVNTVVIAVLLSILIG